MSEILEGITSLRELYELEDKYDVTLGGPGGGRIKSKARPRRMKRARKGARRAKKALAPRASRRTTQAVPRETGLRAKRAAQRGR
jgi:hypothetical protein